MNKQKTLMINGKNGKENKNCTVIYTKVIVVGTLYKIKEKKG